MKIFRTLSALAFASLAALASGCDKNVDESSVKGGVSEPIEHKTEITVLAAASLSDVGAEIKEKFEKGHPEILVLYSFASSGALQAQIEAGAKADVFISASSKQMNALREKNLMLEQSIRELWENKIVLIVNADASSDVSSFGDIASSKIKRAALGEFSSVPAGIYAKEALTNLGMLDAVLPKAVFGSDVRAVLAWVESGDADAGIVYATDAMSAKKAKIIASAPEGSCAKVIYPAGIIKDSPHPKEAMLFLEYLSSSEAAEVFRKYGFDAKNSEGIK